MDGYGDARGCRSLPDEMSKLFRLSLTNEAGMDGRQAQEGTRTVSVLGKAKEEEFLRLYRVRLPGRDLLRHSGPCGCRAMLRCEAHHTISSCSCQGLGRVS